MDKPKILLLTRYSRLGGSSRLRFYDYLPGLTSMGMEVTPQAFFNDKYLEDLYGGKGAGIGELTGFYSRRLATLLGKGRYDLVWIEKEALPWLPIIPEFPLLASKPFVLDFDDAWFHRYDQHKDPVVRYLLGNKFRQLVKNAAAVIAGSDYLGRWATTNGAKTVVRIPTTVDLSRYRLAAPDPGRHFTIGWMGSPSSANYLNQIAVPLKDAVEEGDRLRLIGAGEAALPGVTAERLAWSEATEAEELTKLDVGIMPLTTDSWSEGKCAYKLIQYMAAGLPVIASPVGMNRDVVIDGENGFLPQDHSQWTDAFEALRHDPALRRRMGDAGRKLVEERYTLNGNLPLLVETLQKAADYKR